MPKVPRHREPVKKSIPEGVVDPAIFFRREIYVKAKRFEERVAELFGLLGYRTIVDYQRDAMQFDVRLERGHAAFPSYRLVECKDLGKPVTQKQVREFALKVETIRDTEKRPYQAIMVARSGFVNNAHAVAQTKLVHLLTFQQLLLSLVDLQPNLEAAIRNFEGTPLQRLYVEQDAVLEKDLLSSEDQDFKGLTETVLAWLDQPTSTFLALLGDFGCGKTSFCKRLGCKLATKSKENPGEVRMPILIDLREGGSTTVTLENLLTHHFQRLSSQSFNPQALLHLNREGYLLLIFDGFDETIAYSEPGRYLENLRQILRAAEGKAKVLLTCRTHYFRDRPEELKRLARSPELASSPGATKLYEEIQERAGAEIGYVLEFREPQIEEYLKKALPAPADWKAFREQIRHTYNLEELAERPFLLEIIVKTLPHLMARGSEITLADLYATYCESWFAHTDSHLTLTREHKVALVEYLACLIWNSPENRVHYTALAEKAAEFFRGHSLTAYDMERVDYEVRTALFFHRDAEGYYSFITRSFLEFFIARTLQKGFSKSDPNCLNLKHITREVAFFLEFWPASKKICEVTGEILERNYQPRISENALLLLYFHARARLGPLVGPGSETENLLEIRKTFSGLRPKILNLAGADLEGARIPEIDLSGACLEKARLTRADLRLASLDRARLSKAVLSFADFRQGSAVETDLSAADLSHLDAQKATFQKADLRDADLSLSQFAGADLSGAKLKGVRFTGASILGVLVPSEIPYPASAGPSRAHGLELLLQVGHTSRITSVAWSPNGVCLANGSQDGTIKIWNTGSGRLLNSILGHERAVSTITWAPDGQRIASGSHDRTVRLWDADSGRLLNSISGHENWVQTVAWAPDGQRIASGSDDNTVRLWDPASGRLLNSLPGHENCVLTIAWAPEGRRIASGSDDNTVRLWDADSGQLLNSLLGHEGSVSTIAWAPDGRRIASGSGDSTVRLWDAESGKELGVFKITANTTSFLWKDDGRLLVLSVGLGFNEIWDLETSPPRPLGRFYHTPRGSSFAATSNGYMYGPSTALEFVRFGGGWALYDLADLLKRLSPE